MSSKLKISVREAIRASNRFGSPISTILRDSYGNYVGRGTSNPIGGRPVCAVGAVLLSNACKYRDEFSERDQEKLNAVENGFEGWLHGDYANGRVEGLTPQERGRYTKIGQRLREYAETNNHSYCPAG